MNSRLIMFAFCSSLIVFVGCGERADKEHVKSNQIITDGSHAEKAKLALSPDISERAKFDAVHALAISGYTPESAKALTKVAVDRNAGDTMRGYAAMGLSNFTNKLPINEKEEIQKQLRKAFVAEGYDTPDGVIRTLIGWGDAAFILETLGDEAKGHPNEVEMLAGLPKKEGADRLMQIYESTRESKKTYNERAEIGRALVMKEDKRGVEILLKLLPAESAPSGQHRHNVFTFLTGVAQGEKFGYEAMNYEPEIDEAIPQMMSWWEKNKNKEWGKW